MVLLTQTPVAVLDSLSAMMPRLEAVEARAAARVGGVARSFKPGSWAKKQAAEWDRTARGGAYVQKAPRAHDLSKAGLGIRILPPKRKE